MRRISNRALKALLASGMAACAMSAGAQPPGRATNGVLTDSSGMTLYVFGNDRPYSGESMCVGPCSLEWPPLVAGDDDLPEGDFSIFERYDGTRQWTYLGMPLYRWKYDEDPGDTDGDGVDDAWRVAR